MYRNVLLCILFLSPVASNTCIHPDPLCTHGPPCGPIQNYDGSEYYIKCLGNDECDCQPQGYPVSNEDDCKLIPNKLECVECLSGGIENNCNGGLGMCFRKENGMYRCVKKLDDTGRQVCAFEKDNLNCFCQSDDPPSSPGNPEKCKQDLNKCSPDGLEFCLAPGGQCTSKFDPVLCSCGGTQGFCQDTPDQMCGGDLHKCFFDTTGRDCLPPSTYWCGISSNGKCTIERNPEKCNSCQDFCISQSNLDTSCGGDIDKCSDFNCYCSISDDGRCHPRFDPSKCSGGSEFCTGTPSTNCDGFLNKCLDFDHTCELLDVGGNRKVCSIANTPNSCPVVNCNSDTCNSNNEICKCENDRCSYVISNECENCLGGSTDSENPCNGGLGKCINGKECYVEQTFSGGLLNESCALRETDKCFCPFGSEDSNCFHNVDKCRDGKRCVIDSITKRCDLQRGHDGFCCLEGTFENGCNDFDGACIHIGRCTSPNQPKATEKCVIETDAQCYSSNFCEGDVSTGCNGDIGKCSLKGDFGKCSADSNGKCTIVQDDQCCVEGGTVSNLCNNNQDNCIGFKKCSVDNDLGRCTLDISKDSCFCSGIPENDCGGQLGKSFDGESLCQIVNGECVRVLILDDGSFCANVGENCNGNLGYCNIYGRKCAKDSRNDCVLQDDITCCETGTPGGTNKCNSHEGSCDGDRRCKAKNQDSNMCILENDSECICRDVDEDCNGHINQCISTGGKCKKNASGSCFVEKDMMCCQQGSMQDNCFGNSFTCFQGTNFCVPIGSTGNCDIVQLEDCFCKGDESNNCDNDLSNCFNGLLCELISFGGTNICQTVSSDTCNLVPSPITVPIPPSTSPPSTPNPPTMPSPSSPVSNPRAKKTASISTPGLISVIISSSVVALVGGSILVRRWYLRRNQMDEVDDSFMDE